LTGGRSFKFEQSVEEAVKIRRADAALMDNPKRATNGQHALTPKQLERQQQNRQLVRLVSQINDAGQVFEVRLGPNEKPATIRQRLLRAAADANREIAVRKSENGFLVGLMTPERRSKRGRKAGSGKKQLAAAS
jgi:hypothetical protein